MNVLNHILMMAVWSKEELVVIGLLLALSLWSIMTTSLWQRCQQVIWRMIVKCRTLTIWCLSLFIFIRRMIINIPTPALQLTACSATSCVNLIGGRAFIVSLGLVFITTMIIWSGFKIRKLRDLIESNGAATRDPVIRTTQSNTPYTEPNNIYLMTPENLTNVITKALSPTTNGSGHSVTLQSLIEEFMIFKTDVQQQFNNIESYLQTFYGNVPSANFVSFSFDDLYNKVEDKFHILENNITSRLDTFNKMIAKENITPIEYDLEDEAISSDIYSESEADIPNHSVPISKHTPQVNAILGSTRLRKDIQGTKAVSFASPEMGRKETNVVEVNAIGDTWKKVTAKTQKKGINNKPIKPRTSPKPDSSVTEAQLHQYANMNEDELFNHLVKLRKERREEAAKPKYLTEEEKKLSVVELDRRFREKERLEKEARIEQSKQDLGTLSLREQALPISEIKGLIKQRRYEAWVKDMTDQGVPLHRCTVCGELATQKHRCMSTSWSTMGKSGALPIKKELIMTQSGGGDVRLRQIRQIDPEELEKRHAAIVAEKKKIEIENERLTRLLEAKVDPPGAEVVDDGTMEVVVDMEMPTVNILSRDRNFP